MGTRNLTIVFYKGEYQLAQYCQWDGYPEGQGTTCYKFLKQLDKEKREIFLNNLMKCNILTESEIQARWRSVGATNGANLNQVEAFKKKWPQLQRDMGADILFYILEQKPPVDISMALEFAGDGLFCEWAYVLDFDTNMFEVYSGFNQGPMFKNERFREFKRTSPEYSPVVFKASWKMNDLPTEEEFIKKSEAERFPMNEP